MNAKVSIASSKFLQINKLLVRLGISKHATNPRPLVGISENCKKIEDDMLVFLFASSIYFD
jgi:hypothetical protein